MSRVIILRKSSILLLGLWNTILRIVSFDYNVLSALRPDPSESNLRKLGEFARRWLVKWQFANACKVSVTEGGDPGPGRKWGEWDAANTRGWRQHWAQIPGPGCGGAGSVGLSMDHGTASTESPDIGVMESAAEGGWVRLLTPVSVRGLSPRSVSCSDWPGSSPGAPSWQRAQSGSGRRRALCCERDPGVPGTELSSSRQLSSSVSPPAQALLQSPDCC